MLEREEVVPRYKYASPLYYWKGRENEEFDQRAQNFEPLIHSIVEQEDITQGIKISRGVESILVTRQKIVILPRAEPIIVEGVPMVVRMRYNEPRVN
jgi:hypothetical protein